MAKTKMNINNYKKFGVIIAALVAIGAIVWGVSALTSNRSLESALSGVSADAVSAADIRLAVVRMDAILERADVLQSLRKQRTAFEQTLKSDIEREQKKLEAEKTAIEKQQGVLDREALQRRVMDYQGRVNELQRDLSTRAQAIDTEFQKALARVQSEYLDPVMDGIIAKKQLTVVIDGRTARAANVANLDITDDVVSALNKRVSNIKMTTPKGF
ncbi:MAG: OmpH family outer membrane protein [Rickettsiales bacterium]|jgi:Skp family chaperone for outer membrane proteins|nr:OmpH family outer membrane protein [Rickettsiales bacterium]